jgi:hypothetical protein
MGHALKSIPDGEGSRSTAVASPLVASLLESCKAMLPLVRQHYADTPAGDSVILAAERVIARAERESLRLWGAMPPKSGFFGRVGNHYDFEITVKKVYERARHYRMEGRDRLGRRVIIRVKKDEDPFSISAGETVFFRGRILAHRALFGAPVNYIEATSGVIKV